MKMRVITILGLYSVMIAASIPLILSWVPPNRWYGFRLPGLFESPEMWYEINSLGGKMFALAMVLCLVVNGVGLGTRNRILQEYLGIINATLIVISFWVVSLELVRHLPG